MSELAFPEIDEKAAPVAIVEPKQATLKETALASFAPIVAHMTTLAQRYRDVAFDLLTPKGMAAAKAARLELREEGRYAVQRLQKRLKDEANDLKRTIDAKAEEAIAIVKPVEDAIHEQIEAREAQLAAEKAERERAEAERKARHEAGIAKIRAYLAHCEQPGMTAARIQAGMDMLRAATFGPEWEEYAVPAANAQCETLEGMQRLHDAAVAREAEAARLEAQRLENERVAAELAAQRAELERQQQEIEAARQRAITPVEPMATAPTTQGTAETPEAGRLEAAPNEVACVNATQGKADNPAATVSAPEAAPITQDAQESGFVPGTPGLYASSEAQAAQASPSGAEGRDARADECASQPDHALLWAVHVEGPDDIEAAPSAEAAEARADSLNQWAREKSLPEAGILFNARVVLWPYTASAHAEDLRKLGLEADAAPGGTEGPGRFAMSRDWLVRKLADGDDAMVTAGGGFTDADLIHAQAVAVCPEAAAGHAADIASRDWTAVVFTDDDSIETSEREARPYTGAVQMIDHGIDADDLHAKSLAFVRLVLAARAGRFPSHPKPEHSWWAEVYAAGDALLPRLAKVCGEAG